MNTDRFLAGLSMIFASGQNEQVSDYLRKSLAEAQNEGDDYAAVTILNEMIGYYRITSKHSESIKAAELALELMRRLGNESTVHYGTTMLNAATAYKASGNTARALELFNATLHIYLRELSHVDERLAALYNNLSAIHQDAGAYEKASEYLTKSAEILSQLKGSELDTATVYTNLALALFELGREHEAMNTLQKALAMFKNTAKDGKVDAKIAPHYASTLAGLAGAYYKMKDYSKAAEIYEEALARIKEAYGVNDDYLLTCRNCAAAFEAAGNPAKALAYRVIAGDVPTAGVKKEMKGLALSRAYYEAFGKDMLRSCFPKLEQRIAAGLVGEGSECFGFDDEISRDHDFGPSFCIWLRREDYETYGPEMQKAYDSLPKEFLGCNARIESSHAGRRIGVLCIEDFYRRYTGKTDASLSNLEWLRVPESSLATVTNGEVFSDPLGKFSKIRDAFSSYYPEDIRLKKIAARAAMMAQSGQSNYARCMSRAETVGACMALGEFVKHASSMVFLLNRRYAPFYKWTHRAMRNLAVLPEVPELLAELAITSIDASKWRFATPAEMARKINNDDENIVIIERICQLVRDRLCNEGLSRGNEEFLVPHAEAVLSKIKDGTIRSLHIMEG